MAKPKYAFLRQLPDYFIRKLEDGNLSVTVPGGNMSVTVPAENRFPSADAHGKDIPKHSNIRLGAPDDELTVIVEDSETGNFKSETRTAREISAAWERNQREYAEQKGPKTYLNGVSRAMVHESCIEMQDGTGRKLMQVSVSDPESAPQPVRENGRIVPGKFRSTGYGSFLVSPDSVAPSAVNPDKVNIYLGRENDVIKGYQIFTGEFDENGRGIYEKVGRTAGEIRSNYEADIEAFKAKTAETAKKKPGYPERDVGDTKFLRNVSMDCIEEIGAGQARVKISDDWYAFLDMSDCTPSIDAEGARLVPQRYDIPLPAESVRIERRDPNGSVVRWNAHPNTAIAQCEGFRRKRAEEARRALGPGGEVWMRGVPAERVKYMRVEPDFNIDYIPFGDTGRARVEIHDFECPSKNGSGGHYAYLYLSKDACVKNGDGTYDILLGHERDTDLDYWMPTSDRSLGRLITDHGVEVEGRASFRTPAELVQDDGRDIIGPAMERVAPKDRRLPSYDGVVWARDVDGGYGLGM